MQSLESQKLTDTQLTALHTQFKNAVNPFNKRSTGQVYIGKFELSG